MEFDIIETRKKILSHPAYPFAMSALRGVLAYAVFALMQLITLPALRSSFYKVVEDIVQWKSVVLFCSELLFAVLMLNTVLSSFAIYNRRSREEFLARNPVEYDKAAERQMLLRSGVLWCEIGAFALCLVLFGTFVDYKPMIKPFFPNFDLRISQALMIVFHLAALIGLKIFAEIDARDYWLDLPRRLMKKSLTVSLNDKKKSAYSYWRMVGRLAFTTLLYYFAGMAVTYVIVAGFSMTAILALLIFTPSIFVIILAIVALFYIRTIRARVKLIKKLKSICKDRGFDLMELCRPYRSIFRDAHNDYNIAVKVGERTFYCRLIACVNRGNKYTFNTDGTLTRARMIHMPKPPRMVGVRGMIQTANYGNGDELEIFGFTSEIDYTFEADGEKVILINPVPRRVRKQSGNLIGEMDNGDRLGDYTIYTGNAFLRYIDRLGIDTRGRIFHDD